VLIDDKAPPPVVPPPPPDVITAPVSVRTVQPVYPGAARAAFLEGWVLVQAVVDVDGRIRDVTVQQSSHRVFIEAARNAVRQYEYKPGLRNGVPEPVTMQIKVSFSLRD
jgi:protein TonB